MLGCCHHIKGGVGFFLGPIAHMDGLVRHPGVPDSPGAKSGLRTDGYAHGNSSTSALHSTHSRRPKNPQLNLIPDCRERGDQRPEGAGNKAMKAWQMV